MLLSLSRVIGLLKKATTLSYFIASSLSESSNEEVSMIIFTFSFTLAGSLVNWSRNSNPFMSCILMSRKIRSGIWLVSCAAASPKNFSAFFADVYSIMLSVKPQLSMVFLLMKLTMLLSSIKNTLGLMIF